MKRICLLLVAMMTLVMAFSQETTPAVAKQTTTVENLMKKLEKAKGADYMDISPFMMSLAKAFASSPEEKLLFKYIKSLRVLNYNDCSEADKQKFAQTIATTQFEGFDDLREVIAENNLDSIESENEENPIEEMEETNLYIFVKQQKDKIVRLVTMQADTETGEYVITDMDCDMTFEDLEKLQDMKAFSKQPID